MRKICSFILAAFAAGCAFAASPWSEYYDKPTATFRAICHNGRAGTNTPSRVRLAGKLEQIKRDGGAPIVLIGDSITHFWETNGKDVLAKYFSTPERRMLNLGNSGDCTQHVLWRIDEGGGLDGYEAKIIFLMIGTNNTSFPFDQEPPAETIIGIKKIIDVIRAKQPNAKLVITSIFPRGKTNADDKRRRNDIVNREIRKFCDGTNIVWLDVRSKFINDDETQTLKTELFKDGLHPNAAGYEVWYSLMKPYLDWALDGAEIPPDCGGGEKEGFECSEEPYTHIRRFDFWVKRLERNLRQIASAKGKIDIVFAGDSITHNWDGRGRKELNQLMEKYKVLNLGYSGDTTANLLWRLENGELEFYKAKCIMLMLGINDDGTVEQVASGIKRCLDVIAKKQPQAKVLLLPVFPSKSPGDERRDRGEKVNEIIKGYADGEKVIWADFTDKFLDEKGSTFKNMPDGVHPSPAAYGEIWLPAVLPYFEKIIGEAK